MASIWRLLWLVMLPVLFLSFVPVTEQTDEMQRHSYIRLNHIQQVGVHGSYHRAPRRRLLDFLKSVAGMAARAWEYSHKPMNELLDDGSRNFQLNTFYDPEGGRYAHRAILSYLGVPTKSRNPIMDKPGYKVLHLQDVDFHSTCLTLVDCLKHIAEFSVAHPGHATIFVKLVWQRRSMFELLGPLGVVLLPGAAVPLPCTPQSLHDLEAEILSVVPRSHILTPDEVRGGAPTLLEAIRTKGWPTVQAAAGKIVFVLEPDDVIEVYIKDTPSLEGRLMFTGWGPRPKNRPLTPDTSIVMMEPMRTINTRAINHLVAQNIIVWARTDENTIQARRNDTRIRDLVLASGAQLISTDYPVFEAPNMFRTKYAVGLPNNAILRCNPFNAPPGCSDTKLVEPLIIDAERRI